MYIYMYIYIYIYIYIGGRASRSRSAIKRTVFGHATQSTRAQLLSETHIETDTETDTTTLGDDADVGQLSRLSLFMDQFEPVSPEVLFPAPHRTRSRSRSPESLGCSVSTQHVPSRSPGKRRSPSFTSCEGSAITTTSPGMLLLGLLDLRPMTNTALFEPECACARGPGFLTEYRVKR